MVGADRGEAGDHLAFLFYLQLSHEAICPNNYMCDIYIYIYILGNGYISVIKRRTHDRKVAGSSPDRSGGRIFFFRVNFLC